IVTDGWSIRVIRTELAEYYDAAVSHRTPSLKPLPLQYADFAAWQRSWLSGKTLQRQLDYWKSHLAGVSTLELPADRPPASEPSFRGSSEGIILGKETLAMLKQLANQEGATLFMTLLTAFQSLLQRYTHQEDIVVGSPIANRTRSEIEGIVGFFVNSLVLRTDLSGEPSFREALRRVREVTLKAYEFQDMPFEKLVEELAPERSHGQNPLFQVMFALQNLPVDFHLEGGGLKMSLIPAKALTSRFDIEVHLWEIGDHLEGRLVYSVERFDRPRIARMAAHYVCLLEAVSLAPDKRLANIDMLTFDEREELVAEWNQTAAEYPGGERLEKLFEQQALERPEAVALVEEKESYSYAELNRRANQFAAYLRAKGVTGGMRVGVCLERSSEMIWAVVGILKAGAAYVPLDPTYPKERLSFMISDAQASFVVTGEGFEGGIAEAGVEIIHLTKEWPLVERLSGENVANIDA
ncbi:MAG TPA: condensation domain-containing protein, partial [Terrimicrobiaceae bacterium]